MRVGGMGLDVVRTRTQMHNARRAPCVHCRKDTLGIVSLRGWGKPSSASGKLDRCGCRNGTYLNHFRTGPARNSSVSYLVSCYFVATCFCGDRALGRKRPLPTPSGSLPNVSPYARRLLQPAPRINSMGTGHVRSDASPTEGRSERRDSAKSSYDLVPARMRCQAEIKSKRA